ncbi:unnamed protein product [Vitrella brassicaformis CCMP3155]|uniref:C2 domain-containing protein n=1 Tax=Vitrella brassicaformis (strain CCMP3155) TaxID=1169540 RepID=A0A0G4FGW2_VITBC|nr:unnamed protein product [Vitrella brassicaformis CCMP3155]|eukprot:CEM12741.1 unnamed protein product [Vitrella brassicaformis CCMP3155]
MPSPSARQLRVTIVKGDCSPTTIPPPKPPHNTYVAIKCGEQRQTTTLAPTGKVCEWNESFFFDYPPAEDGRMWRLSFLGMTRGPDGKEVCIGRDGLTYEPQSEGPTRAEIVTLMNESGEISGRLEVEYGLVNPSEWEADIPPVDETATLEEALAAGKAYAQRHRGASSQNDPEVPSSPPPVHSEDAHEYRDTADESQALSNPKAVAQRAIAAVTDYIAMQNAQAMEQEQIEELLKSPRTKTACKRLGFKPVDLRPKKLEDFFVRGEAEEKQQVRFEYAERKRQQRLNQVLDERDKLLEDPMAATTYSQEEGGDARLAESMTMSFLHHQSQGSDTLTSQQLSSLNAIEQLMDREARRLEQELRRELRYHSMIEQENQSQLVREKELQDRLARIAEKQARSREHIALKAQRVKDAESARKERSAELQAQLSESFKRKQQEQEERQYESEQRMEQLQQSRVSYSTLQSDLWRAKRQDMLRRQEEAAVDRAIRGEQYIGRYQARVSTFEQRKAMHDRQKKMLNATQEIRYLEQQERLSKLKEDAKRRRDSLMAKIKAREEQIETLEMLKSQIIMQRKARSIQQAALRSTGISLKKMGPGPYLGPHSISSLGEQRAPKIATTSPPSFIDVVQKMKRDVPAPGIYNVTVSTKGAKSWGEGPRAVMPKATGMTFSDQAARIAKSIPGPGTYKAPSTTLAGLSPVKLSPEYFPQKNPEKQLKDTRSTARLQKSEDPGPGSYSTDGYIKAAGRMKTNQSLPLLKKAMQLI